MSYFFELVGVFFAFGATVFFSAWRVTERALAAYRRSADASVPSGSGDLSVRVVASAQGSPPPERSPAADPAGRPGHGRPLAVSRARLAAVLAASGLLSGCSFLPHFQFGPQPSPAAAVSWNAPTVVVAGRSYRVDRAAVTDAARLRGARGLRLQPGHVVVFVWPSPVVSPFTMDGGGLAQPLDLLWSRDGKVLGVTTMPLCGPGRGCGTFLPGPGFTLAVEAPAGTFSGVRQGDRVVPGA